MRKLSIVGLVLVLIGCVPPRKAHAQFIGFTSPQSVQSNLATNLNCTGSAQTFITGTTPRFNNIGQTQHLLTVSNVTGAQKFQAEIDGIDNQGNVTRISDVIEEAGTSAVRQGTVAASGYFPQIQVLVTCSPGSATFTASYSGTSAITIQNAGSYLAAQLDKIDWFAAPANANQTDAFQTPFGSSAGTLYFQYTNATTSGAALTVQCSPQGFSAGATTFSVVPAQVNTLQVFQVPDASCPLASVSYSNTGSAGNVSTEYVFATPGRTFPGTQYAHITATTATAVKSTLGFVHTISINTGAAGTVSLFDLVGSSCTGTPATNTVAVITATTTTLQTFTYDVNMLNGICVKASVGMDITVSWK